VAARAGGLLQPPTVTLCGSVQGLSGAVTLPSGAEGSAAEECLQQRKGRGRGGSPGPEASEREGC